MTTEADVRGRTTPLLVGYGAGVNSLAALIAMYRRGIVPDLITFANTGGAKSDGGEKPETYAYIEKFFKPWLASVKFPELVVVYNKSPKAGYTSLEDDCVKKETMPSRAFGLSSCAMRWKVEPQDRFLNRWPPAKAAWARGEKPIKVLGYDGGEQRRADISEDKKLRYWYPLIEWDLDRDACVELIHEEGLPIPVKSACYYCPSSTKTEVIQLSLSNPALFRRAVEMERIALTSKRHDLRNIKGLGRHWSWADLVAADEGTRAKMQEAPVESCITCDDDGCVA